MNIMIKNYLVIAWRNLSKRKGYSLINIGGLAVGVAACLLLYTVVRYELSYDKFNPNYERVYRIVTQDKFSEGIDYTPGIPFPALEAVRTTFPGYTSGAMFASYGSQVTVVRPNNTSGGKIHRRNGLLFLRPAVLYNLSIQMACRFACRA